MAGKGTGIATDLLVSKVSGISSDEVVSLFLGYIRQPVGSAVESRIRTTPPAQVRWAWKTTRISTANIPMVRGAAQWLAVYRGVNLNDGWSSRVYTTWHIRAEGEQWSGPSVARDGVVLAPETEVVRAAPAEREGTAGRWSRAHLPLVVSITAAVILGLLSTVVLARLYKR